MNKILIFIGSIVITLLIMSVPVLCTLSFVYDWIVEAKFTLTLITVGFGILLWAIIYGEAEE